eukprot:TRINITY_DN15391_c0_g2_i1.p2 TRINITY_DN15391_c0_g2~~TRINITY_DN15391_c0_g2_i1.p2  ORF type:complete len:390 (+),score=87.65 TRINITY_DN15391_c0_g2_i1:75-1244(+)
MGNLCGCAPDPAVVAAADAAAGAGLGACSSAPATAARPLAPGRGASPKRAASGPPAAVPPPEPRPRQEALAGVRTGRRRAVLPRGQAAEDRERFEQEHDGVAVALLDEEHKEWVAIISVASELQLAGRIGGGTFARVHAALRCLSGALRPLAAKELRRTEDVSAFRREVELLHRACGAPHLVGFFGAEYFRGRDLMIFEHAAFGDLESRMRLGRFSMPAAWVLTWHISLGTAGLHARGVLHRDIKPENVLLVGGPRKAVVAKLADLGVAALLPPHGTVRGFAGTPQFAAPEVLNGAPEGYGTPADIFSLGCVWHEVATARAARQRRGGRWETEDIAMLAPDLQQWGRLLLSDNPSVRPAAQQVADGMLQAAQQLLGGRKPRLLAEDLPG